MSVIARTAGIGRTPEELQWDLNYLMQLWRAVEEASKLQPGAYLIYQESSLVIRAIRDYFHADIGEILIDTEAIYEQAQQFMAHVMPDNVHRVKLYKDDVPLFSRFQIEHQIETAYARQVPLPSGGAIVIDHTEALVSIDVNSARATKGGDIETTAFNTNLEAADELARQLRLRDLGGLIVVDFIDMESTKNQREVENRLRDALHYDRARIQLGKISRFGLMELSRQRLRPALAESAYIPCPRCHGIGHIRGTESTALHILRILQEEAMKDNTAQVVAQVPVDVATFLLNEKRSDVLSIETRFKVNVLLVPNLHLETPNYKIDRLRHDDLNNAEPLPMSFDMVETPEQQDIAKEKKEEAKEVRQEAVVKGITPSQPAPVPAEAAPAPAPQQAMRAPAPPAAGTWFDRMMGWFRPKAPTASATPARPSESAQQDRQRRDGRDNRDARGRAPGQERREGNQQRRDERRGDGRHEGRDRRDEQRRGDRRDDQRRDGQPRQQTSPPGQRSGQQPRGEQRRGEGRREDAPRDEQANRPQEARREQQPRPERERREGPKAERAQGERKPAAPEKQAAPVAALVEGEDMSLEGAQDARREGGRRRRRRGRGGADRQPQATGAAAETGRHAEEHDALTSPDAPAKFADVSAKFADAPAKFELPEAFEPVPPAPPRAEEAIEPIRHEPPPVPAEPRRPAYVSHHAPQPPHPKPIEAPAPYTLPSDSGLELVETQRKQDASPSAEDMEPPRPRRVRPPRAAIADEPLEVVETRKDAPPAP
jgi:ribonuclease E